MARKHPRIHRNERGDHVGLRGAHNSFAPVPLHDLHGPLRPFTPLWCELAITAVAVMCGAALPNVNRCAPASVAIECTEEAADTTRTP
jgi:hypothetical protein